MAHPRRYDDSDPTIQRLRRICLALAEVFEKEAWGECTFRVTGGSMFAMTDNDHHGSGHQAVWFKATLDTQDVLVHTDPKRFFVPPYVGSKGWIGMRLDSKKVDWDEVADLIEEAYRLSLPKGRRSAAPTSAPVKRPPPVRTAARKSKAQTQSAGKRATR